jgi:hypothetical protein
MKSRLATVAFLFLFSAAFSQDSFVNGYVVNKSKDTLRGLIHQAIEEDLFASIQFKENQSAPLKVFLPGQIEAFGMDEDIFRSVSFLNTSLDNPVLDSCFAKQLVSGKYNLYTYSRKERRFYVVISQKHAQLLFDNFYTNLGDPVQDGNFTSRMRLIMNECPEVSLKYQGFEFGQKQMAGYFENLDRCVAPASAKSYYHKNKTDMNLYLVAGSFPLKDYEQFCAEIGVRFNAPNLSRNTFLNVGLRYTYLNYISHDNDKNYPNIIYSTTTTSHIYSIPVTIQYDFLLNKIRPYVYAGFSALYNNETITTNFPYPDPDPIHPNFSPILGFGIEGYITKHLFLKVDERYEVYVQYPYFSVGYSF